MRYSVINFVNYLFHICKKLHATIINLYDDVNCRMRLVENSSRSSSTGNLRGGFVWFRRKSIRKTWISVKDALSNGQRIRELSLAPLGNTSELWSEEMGTRYTVGRW